MRGSKLPLLLAVGIVVAVIIAVRPGGGRSTPAPPGAPGADVSSPRVDSGRVEQSANQQRSSEAPRADFIFLFDISTSTHTGDAVNPFIISTQILEPAVNALRSDRVEHVFLPSRYRVGTIGHASLMQQPLCDFRVEPTMVFRSTDTSATTRHVEACTTRLKAVTPENATDIRGALHFAGLTLRGDRRMLRGIVLITDLEEFIPTGRSPAVPDLRGICVSVHTVMTPKGAARPDSLAAREADWRGRITQWGAKKVRVQSILGFDADDLATFFRSCGQ